METIPQVDVRESSVKQKTLLILHRGRVFEELLQAFKQDFVDIDEMKIEMVLPNGQKETAQDFGGVLKDALSEFWQSFYEKCTLGTTFKVPCLRHDFGEIPWGATAKILVTGWKHEQYFPIKLAPSFISACIGVESSETELIDDFLKYVSDGEKETLNKALKDFNAVDIDDLIDVLSNFESKWVPNKDNVKTLLAVSPTKT